MTSERGRLDSVPDRVFRLLLRAYPKSFRGRFEVGMTHAFTHRRWEVGRSGQSRVLFWLATIGHALLFGLLERVAAFLQMAMPHRGSSVPGTIGGPNDNFNFQSSGPMQFLDTLRRDLFYAVRGLLKRPAMTVLATVTFSLGIAASSALFSVVESVLLRPLPYPDPDELVSVHASNPSWRGHPTMGDFADRGTFSWPEIAELREHQTTFEAMAAVRPSASTLSADGRPERISTASATYELFPMLGIAPLRGRVFDPHDDNRAGERAVLLSEDYWSSRFAADSDIVGKTIRLDDELLTIVGVLPESFRLAGFEQVRAWVPRAGSSTDGNRGNHNITRIIGRLADGVSIDQARQDLTTILEELSPPDHPVHGASVYPRHADETRDVRAALIVLIVASFVLLAVACGNVAAILLGAGIERERELAVRGALGAGRARIAQQLLTESLVIAGLGALGGLGLAAGSMNLLLSLAPDGIPRIAEASLNLKVVSFAVAVSMGSGVLFGLIPALSLSRADLSRTLQSSRGAVEGRTRIQSAVVVGELTLATVLLVSGALLSRTLVELNGVDLGFDPDDLLTVRVAAPYQRFSGENRQSLIDSYFQQIIDQMESAPGIRSVAVTSVLALGGGRGNNDVHPEGWDVSAQGSLQAERRFVSANFFDAMRTEIVDGRGFDSRDDRQDSPPTIVISESLARRAWPNESAVGKRVGFWGRDPHIVVGVAEDLRDHGLDTVTELAFYVPARQMGGLSGDFLVRTDGDPMAVVPTLRERIWSVHPDLPITSTISMTQRMANSLGAQRYRARLMTVFSLLAGLFAVLGIYGITARSVAQRTQEMGIRVALGAERTQVMRLVVFQGMRLAASGVLIGMLLSLVTGRLLESMLFGVSTTDPLTLVSIIVLVTGASVIASLPPSFRATRVDPMVALRTE